MHGCFLFFEHRASMITEITGSVAYYLISKAAKRKRYPEWRAEVAFSQILYVIFAFEDPTQSNTHGHETGYCEASKENGVAD